MAAPKYSIILYKQKKNTFFTLSYSNDYDILTKYFKYLLYFSSVKFIISCVNIIIN